MYRFLRKSLPLLRRKYMIAPQRDDVAKALTQPTYSIVAPVFNEEETLPQFYARMIQVMETLDEPFELILVNDGSKDASFKVMKELHASDPRVHILDFSRNFGHQIAISAGLDYARGKAVVVIDSDLQDPPEVILDLIGRWKDGAEVVYAQRTSRVGETKFKLITASLFYRLIDRITSVHIPRNVGDFRLMDRSVVDTLITLREHHRFMRGLSSWVGFRQEAVLYERHERYAGSSKYPLLKIISFSLDASAFATSDYGGFHSGWYQLIGYRCRRFLAPGDWCHRRTSLNIDPGPLPWRYPTYLPGHNWRISWTYLRRSTCSPALYCAS
jgi:glycosyltransferase involved in cell wall biosynthesis